MTHRAALVAALLFAATLAPDARAAEPVTLKIAFPPPPISTLNTEAIAPWAKEVEAASGGTVKFRMYIGPSLANFVNVYDRILNGVADIGFGIFGPYSHAFPQVTVTEVPSGRTSAEQAGVALWRLYANGVIAGEFTKVKLLGVGAFPAPGIRTQNRPLRRISDFKGLKLATTSRTNAEIAKLLGAAPVTVTTSELYQSMQRGLVDGMIIGWAATKAFKLYEVSNYELEIPNGLAGDFVMMNKASFARLPEAAQKAIDAHSGEALSHRMGRAGDHETEVGSQLVLKMPGQKQVVPSAEEEASWTELLAPLAEKWVKQVPEGQHVLDAYRAELGRLRAGK